MNWQPLLIVPGFIGVVGFFFTGLRLLLLARRKAAKAQSMLLGGIGLLLFALFIAFFVVSVVSTSFAFKIIAIIIALIVVVPAIILMLVSITFSRKSSNVDGL